MAHKVQVGGHLWVTTTQEDNPVLDPDTRSDRLLSPWVFAQAHLMPVRGLGDERRPVSRRGVQGPRGNFCASRASSRWVGVCMKTLVEARRRATKGKLLQLGVLQWVGWGMDDDRGRGAAAKDPGRTFAARRPAVGGLGDGRRPRSRRGGRGARADFCGSAACSGWVGGRATTVVEALRPRNRGKLLRLKGQE